MPFLFRGYWWILWLMFLAQITGCTTVVVLA